jgi:acylphosphatase
VEVVAAGDEASLGRLRALLAKGSRGSRVDAIEQRDLDPSEADALGPFEIEGAW